ncbi:MAG: hypothetical protein ACRC6M_02525 [Microcystaceae cyanobacterium]
MPKKSKGFSELFHQDSIQKRRPSRSQTIRQKELADFDDFKQEIKGKTDKNAVFVDNPPDLNKMSETLIEFVLPFLDGAKTYEERLYLFELAVVGWNLALIPEEEREQVITTHQQANLLNPKRGKDNRTVSTILEQFIKRKLVFFAEEQRFIDDFKLTERSGRIHISISSSLHP